MDSSIKIQTTVGGIGTANRLATKPNKSYSWKSVYDLENNKHEPKVNEAFPLWVYTQPVGEKFNQFKGTSEFCKISGEQIAPENWYAQLGIEHFYLFSIRLEK